MDSDRDDVRSKVTGTLPISASVIVDRSRHGFEVVVCPDGTVLLPEWFDATLAYLGRDRPAAVSATIFLVPETVELDSSLYEGPLGLDALPLHIRLVFVSYDRKIAIMLGMMFALHPIAHRFSIVHTMEEALELLR